MSAKSERKRQIKAEKQAHAAASVALNGAVEPLEPLPTFNEDQLSNEAIDRLPEATTKLAFCNHLTQSRKNPDTDFYGYMEKFQGPHGSYVIVRQCHECALKFVGGEFEAVARVPYQCLSDFTLKAMLKNQGESCLVPQTERGKKLHKQLTEQTAAEGPDTIN